MWLNVGPAGVLVVAGVALGGGLGIVGVSLGGRRVAVAVTSGVTDGAGVGAGVGVEGVQAALIVAAAIKITSVIDFLIVFDYRVASPTRSNASGAGWRKTRFTALTKSWPCFWQVRMMLVRIEWV